MKITINGKVIESNGSNVQVQNENVFVDGVLISEGKVSSDQIIIHGNVGNITTDRGSVEVRGSVEGDIRAGGSVNCDNVGGSIEAKGSVNCDDVQGSVKAGGSINADKIYNKEFQASKEPKTKKKGFFKTMEGWMKE